MREIEGRPDEFYKLGRFWRHEQEFDRAMCRLKRALELSPGHGFAKLEEGRVLVDQAIESLKHKKPLTATDRQKLSKATEIYSDLILKTSDSGEDRQKTKLLHDTLRSRAWVLDELNRLDHTRENLIKACEDLRRSHAAGKILVDKHGAEWGTATHYNLICVLVRLDALDEALSELQDLVCHLSPDEIDEQTQDVDRDPDLNPLRDGGPRYEKLKASLPNASPTLIS